MIVQPDFLTHWKTQMLISALNDPCTPLYVIALWAHCQTSRRDRFDGMTGGKLAAMCRYSGDGDKLLEAMVSIGFLEYEGDTCVVHGWAELNARLLHNWKVGLLGGRPKNPRETQGLAEENPRLTLGEPLANPLDKSRVDKSRKEKSTSPKSTPAPTHAIAWSIAEGWSGILPDDKKEWGIAYPACDLNRQLAAMSAWLHSNPTKAVKRNWRRFVTNWLSKAQDRGGDLLSRGNGEHRPDRGPIGGLYGRVRDVTGGVG